MAIKDWEKDKIEQANQQQAMRFNRDKPKWSLVDFESLVPMIRVLEFGSKKYTPNNWKKGMPEKELLESTIRHVTAMLDGEENDSDSGLSHMAHVQCNSMFYNYLKRNKKFINENTGSSSC